MLMSDVCGVPGQTPSEGVTTTVADWAAPLGDWVVKFRLPLVPLPGKPMRTLLLVQLYCVPGVDTKVTATFSPTHFETSGSGFITGTALTVVVNVWGVPVHPNAVGVTVMVPVWVVWVCGVVMEMLPEPLLEIPVKELLLVQLYVAVGKDPSNVTAIGWPPQTVWAPTAFAVGTGFTVTLNVWVAPKQPPKVGAMLMVAVSGVSPGAKLLKLTLAVEPLAARPILVLLFVQAYWVPAGPLKVTAIGRPAQRVTSLIGLMAGTGLTVTLNVIGCPLHPFSLGVTTIVEVCGAVTAAALRLISPVPNTGTPVAVLLLVQP